MKYLGLMLDFGGVILKTPFEMHRLVEKKLGVANNTLTWDGPFDPDSDLLWIKMQKDEITEQDYWHEKSKLVGKLAGENASKYCNENTLNLINEEAAAQIIRKATNILKNKI